MATNEKPEAQPFETVEPIGKRVLIRKDEDKKETKGGIKLPDNIEIPTITGRIVAVSAEIETMPEIPLVQYDKVLFNPKGAIPVDFEAPLGFHLPRRNLLSPRATRPIQDACPP